MAAPGKGTPGRSSYDYQGVQIGKYQVITRLSVGGMAELFLGFTAGPGGFRKYVALKRILPDVRSNEQFERMFLDEARITAAFNHPNIAQVYELGQEEDGLYLSLEFISGQDLDHVAAAYRRRKEPIPLGLSLGVVRDVCLALQYAHTFTDPSGRPSPVIHRDVAQKNIMVTYDGVVKLLDFGIAKARNSLERTRAGTVKGTAGYMSPEQVRGDPLDGRSDLFSVGVVLWELVTGERLFAGESERDEMIKILEAPIPTPRHKLVTVPEELSAVILRALDRNPGERWQSGKEMARALETAAGEMMFDADRRAQAMRELFAEKMAATRQLLESADPRMSGEAAAVPWSDEGGGSSSVGTEIYEKKAPEKKAPPEKKGAAEKKAPAGKKVSGDKASRARTEAGPPEAGSAASTQVSIPRVEGTSSESRWMTVLLWGVLLMGIAAGGTYVAMDLGRKMEEQVPQEPPPKVAAPGGPALKIFPEPGQPEPGTPSAATDGGTVAGGTAGAEKKPAPGEEAEEAEDKPGKSGRVAQGKLTLIINPEAEVFRGKRSLGKTPMFNETLPVGTHLLRIVGPDGKKRKLSVPIKKGETTKLRFALGDLPEAG
ncbi:serine/threonine-protein kinase [Hyalangium rubrum]|uniref:Serine/threonine-protein kinase n=1 Tax=Hyalangium rubrum TaxID=3103134 RepID=A0ABU5HIA6_9BACT|nr:serine/threonine-protein kinase [Hyalangium sp. s54d21]MDY7233179.1 serine/threonine-protein kinase [Hyalangium sp. s54d21]